MIEYCPCQTAKADFQYIKRPSEGRSAVKIAQELRISPTSDVISYQGRTLATKRGGHEVFQTFTEELQ